MYLKGKERKGKGNTYLEKHTYIFSKNTGNW